jgi:hypothetical protein
VRKIVLSEWAQIAEIVAAVAVVFSLIYVGFELQENTSAVRAASVQSTTTGIRDGLMMVASDADFTRIVRLGSYERSALSEDEAYRFGIFSRQHWLFFQGMWVQHSLDVLDDSAWQSYQQIICSVLRLPGNREDWPSHVNALNHEFVAWFEECSVERVRAN